MAKAERNNHRRAKGSSAVMSQRSEPTDSLDDFPTAPWGVRCLPVHVLTKIGVSLRGRNVWEPAAGRGIMAEVLREYGCTVFASDVHNYPDRRAELDQVGSFVGEGLDVVRSPLAGGFDLVITNPPFRLALEFVQRAMREAEYVCMLCRSNWAEGEERFVQLFDKTPPIVEAQFVERLPLVDGAHIWVEDGERDEAGKLIKSKRRVETGGYDPDASSATAYSWFVFKRHRNGEACRKIWIPPGQRTILSKPTDPVRYGKKPETMLI